MKKFLKCMGALAGVAAALAGGVALYKKYFATNTDLEDSEDDLEEEFEEDLDAVPERGYVSLSGVAEEASEKTEEAAEETSEKAEEAAEEALDKVEEAAADEAAQEACQDCPEKEEAAE